MKIRAAIKIIDGIHTNRRARVPTWRRAMQRYKQYRKPSEDWIVDMFCRLFTSGIRSIRPLRSLRDEISEHAASVAADISALGGERTTGTMCDG